MDIQLITLLVQSGFAGLFVWLLIETRKDAKRDKEKAEQREDRLHALVNTITANYANIAGNIQHIAKFMADNSATSQRVAGVLDSISAMMRRMQMEIGQIQGQLGIIKSESTRDLSEGEGGGE